MTRKTIGIVAGGLLVLFAAVYLGLKFYIENDAKGRIHDWANHTGRISNIAYQSLDVGLFSRTIQASQVSIRIKDVNSPVFIDRLMLHSFDIENEIPSFMHVEIQGIHISQDSPWMKGISPALSQMGYADFSANVEYAYSYEPVKKDLEIQRLCISIPDMGSVEVSARLNNLDLAALKSVPDNPLSLIALVPAVAISGIVLDYQDNSLAQKLIAFGASQSEQHPEQLVSAITEQMNSEIQKQNQPAIRDMLLAFRDFLETPGRIRLAVSPAQPVPLLTLLLENDPNERIRMLNVSVNYQKPKK